MFAAAAAAVAVNFVVAAEDDKIHQDRNQFAAAAAESLAHAPTVVVAVAVAVVAAVAVAAVVAEVVVESCYSHRRHWQSQS